VGEKAREIPLVAQAREVATGWGPSRSPGVSEVEAIAGAGELVLPKRVNPIRGPRAQADHLCDSFEFAAARDLVVTSFGCLKSRPLFRAAGRRGCRSDPLRPLRRASGEEVAAVVAFE